MRDQRRYQIMQQVGMSPREVRSSIRSQVLLVFFLPLVTAGIHVAAAFPMLCKLLELFNLFDVRLFALCAAGTLLVFCAIYALVYGLTTRTYSRIVGGQWDTWSAPGDIRYTIKDKRCPCLGRSLILYLSLLSVTLQAGSWPGAAAAS